MIQFCKADTEKLKLPCQIVKIPRLISETLGKSGWYRNREVVLHGMLPFCSDCEPFWAHQSISSISRFALRITASLEHASSKAHGHSRESQLCQGRLKLRKQTQRKSKGPSLPVIYTMESHGASIWKNRECVVIHTCYGPCGIAGESRLDWSLNLLRYLQVVEFVMRFQTYFNNLGDQEQFGIRHQSKEDIHHDFTFCKAIYLPYLLLLLSKV